LDENILELSQNVSNFFFPGTGKPDLNNILTGYKNLFSDINYSAVVSITARKMAQQVTKWHMLMAIISDKHNQLYNQKKVFGLEFFFIIDGG
jgi:hypothetical protein